MCTQGGRKATWGGLALVLDSEGGAAVSGELGGEPSAMARIETLNPPFTPRGGCGAEEEDLSTASYVVPLVPCLMYSVYFGGFLAIFVIEKMGMIGSNPPPYGYFVPDMIVAAVVGLVTGWCFGPLLTVVRKWLAKAPIIKVLLHASVLALALSSQFFPYSKDAPKRVVLQHTVQTIDQVSALVLILLLSTPTP